MRLYIKQSLFRSLCSGWSPSGSFYLRLPLSALRLPPPFSPSSSSVPGVSSDGRRPPVVTAAGAGPLLLLAAPSHPGAFDQDGWHPAAGGPHPPQRVGHFGEGGFCLFRLRVMPRQRLSLRYKGFPEEICDSVWSRMNFVLCSLPRVHL